MRLNLGDKFRNFNACLQSGSWYIKSPCSLNGFLYGRMHPDLCFMFNQLNSKS